MMKFRVRSSLTVVTLIGALATGCSKSGSSADSSSGGAVSNISGKISDTSSSSALYKPSRKDEGEKGDRYEQENVSQSTYSGCTVQALDLATNAVVGTATSDSSSNYTVTGVTAGESYKVAATCGTTVLTSIAAASVSDPAALTDDQRVETTPKSTIIAAMAIQGLLESAEDALTSQLAKTPGLSVSAQAALKAKLLAGMKSILVSSIELITAGINDSINGGSMAVPTTANVQDAANALKSSTSSAALATAVTATSTNIGGIPDTVISAAAGAKNQTAAFMACNTTLNPGTTLDECTVAVAKFFRNGLGFAIWIKTSGGAFGTFTGGCAGTATTTGTGTSANLRNVFPNSKFATGGDIPAGYCEITPDIGVPDRNRGFEDGGDDGGRVKMAETGIMYGSTSTPGMLTAVAQAMFYGKTYKFSDIDKMVFSSASASASTFSGNGESNAGMNVRLAQKSYADGDFINAVYKYFNGSSWTVGEWTKTTQCGFQGASGAAKACRPREIQFNFTDLSWTTASDDMSTATGNEGSLAAAIGGASNLTLQPFKAKFGGTLPTQAELDSYIDEERRALDRNPTGTREFSVVTSSAVNEPACYDGDPSTVCTVQPLELTFTRVAGVSGYRRISGLSVNATSNAAGNVYLRPMYNGGGFSGAFQMIRAEDGRLVRDEFQKERGIRIITANGVNCPDGGGGCTAGQLYNVAFNWSNCNPTNPNGCPAIEAIAGNTQAITLGTGLAAKLNVNTQWKTQFAKFVNGASTYTHNLVGRGRWDQLEFVQFRGFSANVSTNGGNDYIKSDGGALGYSKNPVATAGDYNAAIWYQCESMSTCASPTLKVYFVDSTGSPYMETTVGATYRLTTATMVGPNTTLPVGTFVMPIADLSLATSYFPTAFPDRGTAADGTTALGVGDPKPYLSEAQVNSAPVANRNFKCEGQPYFINVGGTSSLDCTATTTSGDNATTEANGDISFDSKWQIFDYFRRNPTADFATVQQRKNGYSVSDPAGTRNLLTTAFNGKFTGKESLDENSKFDAIQAFSLVFMMLANGSDEIYMDLDSSTPNASYATVELPVFDNTAWFNKYFSNAFYTFVQP